MQTNEKNCLLSPACELAGVFGKCNKICPFYIYMHGQSGKGGMVGNANIPADYSRMTIKNNPIRETQPEVYQQIDKYFEIAQQRLSDPEGERVRSLYLYSYSPGTGKTSTACAIGNSFLVAHFINSMRNGAEIKDDFCYFLDFNLLQSKFAEFNNPNVPREIKEPASKEFYHSLKAAKEAKILILDDIGIRAPSDAFQSIAHDLINHRVVTRMTTLFTSNIEMDDLDEVYDKRLKDRIKDQCIQIDFYGDSQRGIRKDF
ncbi:DNA replication protein DnaC [Seinonella peptonophila]|uniref:DNA replication protein DnaC n=1 Tax=Seinonella peptonophila TaxID=112248 RepID=A0A1M4V9Y2_9BACL|nr:hypothetical protein [Seinonella peptonophila]SHE65811.1 DNA replication protein DnaC [Seinonella peptonophila]